MSNVVGGCTSTTEITMPWIFYLPTAIAAAMAAVANTLWIVLRVMGKREGGKSYRYITRDSIAKLEQLFMNQTDPGRRRLCLSMLHICGICASIILILLVFLFASFLGYALYQHCNLRLGTN